MARGGGAGRGLPVAPSASPITYPEVGVALCYPYLVTQHGVIDIANGYSATLWPDDTALRAVCNGTDIAVVGARGVYFVRGGQLRGFVLLNYSDLVGATPTYAAFLLPNWTMAFVSASGAAEVVRVPVGSVPLSFSTVDGVPEALVYLPNGTALLYVSTARVAVNLTGVEPAALLNGSAAYVEVESGGRWYLWELSTNATPPYYRLVRDWLLPVPANRLYEAVGPYVLASYANITIMYYLSQSPEAGLLVVGQAEPTPVGYYRDGVTYVLSPFGWVPVPGYAFAKLGDAAALTDVGGVTEVYPFRATILVLSAPLTGYLVVGTEYVLVVLSPGAYELPSGASILAPGGYTVQLSGGVVYYPQADLRPSPSGSAFVLDYRAPYVAEFEGVYYVASGLGYLLMLTHSGAVVYSPLYGEVVIPGEWTAGGFGPYFVALYSSSQPLGNLSFFALDGTLLSSYHVSLPPRVYMMYGLAQQGAYYALVVPSPPGVASSVVTYEEYGPSGLVGNFSSSLVLVDQSTGLRVLFVRPYEAEISLGNATANVSVQGYEAEVNGLYVTYMVSENSFYLLDAASGREVLLLVPNFSLAYPLPGGYVAVFYQRDELVRVFDLAQLAELEPRVEAVAGYDASILVNGTLAGYGNATVYLPYLDAVNVTGAREYFVPRSAIVKALGPATLVNVTPGPLPAYVRLELVAPVPVGYLNVSVNGSAASVRNGGALELVAGLPYVVTVYGEEPLNVCRPVSVVVAPLAPGASANASVSCALSVPVAELFSAVPANVTVVNASGAVVFAASLLPGQRAYVPLKYGRYTVEVYPEVAGYAAEVFELSATRAEVVVLNVTPPPTVTTTTTAHVTTTTVATTTTTTTAVPPRPAYLSVSVTPSSAKVVVQAANGTVVAEGVGGVFARLPPGTYTVTASAPGYRTVVEQVSLEPNTLKTLQITLQRAAVALPSPSRYTVVYVAAGLTAAAVAAYVIYRRASATPPQEI